jgi:hypothetical protein
MGLLGSRTGGAMICAASGALLGLLVAACAAKKQRPNLPPPEYQVRPATSWDVQREPDPIESLHEQVEDASAAPRPAASVGPPAPSAPPTSASTVPPSVAPAPPSSVKPPTAAAPPSDAPSRPSSRPEPESRTPPTDRR